MKESLPASLDWLFPEYKFEALDPDLHAEVIIERVLERGTWEQLRWLFARFGERRIAD